LEKNKINKILRLKSSHHPFSSMLVSFRTNPQWKYDLRSMICMVTFSYHSLDIFWTLIEYLRSEKKGKGKTK